LFLWYISYFFDCNVSYRFYTIDISSTFAIIPVFYLYYNNKNHFDRVHNSFGEFIPKYSSKEYSIKRNDNKLLDEISSKKDDYKKDSKEFISELRRLRQNKDYKPKNNKKTYTNKISNQQPKLSVCYSTPLIDTNKTNIQNNEEKN